MGLGVRDRGRGRSRRTRLSELPIAVRHELAQAEQDLEGLITR